jgi:hypothetical protein
METPISPLFVSLYLLGGLPPFHSLIQYTSFTRF